LNFHSESILTFYKVMQTNQLFSFSKIILILTTLQAISNETQIPLKGSAQLGYYYVQVKIGTPKAQIFDLILDTGSGLTILPC